MVPPYRPRTDPGPLSSRKRLVALLVGVAVVLGGLAVALWSVAQPGSSGNAASGCIQVSLPTSIGGMTVNRCGDAARTWCRDNYRRSDAVGREARQACDQAGFAP